MTMHWAGFGTESLKRRREREGGREIGVGEREAGASLAVLLVR
jgi:hypothetical protein